MKQFYLTLLALTLLSWMPGWAQNGIGCTQFEQLEELYEMHPEWRAEHQHKAKELSQWTAEYTSGPYHSRSRQAIIIPVVFHVIHANGSENISDEQIMSAMDILNEDFSNTNPKIDDLVSDFTHLAADVGFHFCLAGKDPDGNPTTGINRYAHPTFSNDGSNVQMKSVFGWPPSKYLNIYVVKSSDGNNGSGFAFLPPTATGANEVYDGIVMSHWALGRVGTATLGYYSVISHEVGHWANLLHIWGGNTANGSGCNDDDDVADTPNCAGYDGTCFTLFQSCGSLDLIQNHMDYSQCPNMFTEGQKARMLATMNSSVANRNNIWSEANLIETGCIPPVGIEETSSLSDLHIFPNPAQDQLQVSFLNTEEGPVQLELYNGLGQVVLQENFNTPIGSASRTIQLGNLPAGFYMVTLSGENGVGLKKKLLIQ